LKPALPAESPAPAKGLGHTRSFRKHGTGPRLTREQEKRQNDVLQSAWRHFGMPGPVIAFLNTRNEQLQGQPLHLAVQSDEGLIQVERLLGEMTLKA
jgi:hypothetical protein